MRLTRRKRHTQLTDEERDKIAEATAAADEAVGQLAVTRSRGAEVESIVGWLYRARQENHFSLRVKYMIEHPGEEPPWPS